MKTLITSLIAVAAEATQHFVPGYPTLWVTHVRDASICDVMNDRFYAFNGIKDLYSFDQ